MFVTQVARCWQRLLSEDDFPVGSTRGVLPVNANCSHRLLDALASWPSCLDSVLVDVALG